LLKKLRLEISSSGAKAPLILRGFVYGLKPVPFTRNGRILAEDCLSIVACSLFIFLSRGDRGDLPADSGFDALPAAFPRLGAAGSLGFGLCAAAHLRAPRQAGGGPSRFSAQPLLPFPVLARTAQLSPGRVYFYFWDLLPVLGR
jgi:hypothetical protein